MLKIHLEITSNLDGKPVREKWVMRDEKRMIVCMSGTYCDMRKFRKALRNLSQWMVYGEVDLSEVKLFLKRADAL